MFHTLWELVGVHKRVLLGHRGYWMYPGHYPYPQESFCGVAMSALLQVKKLSEHAILPVRGSAFAAGYDLARCAGAPWFAHGSGLGLGMLGWSAYLVLSCWHLCTTCLPRGGWGIKYYADFGVFYRVPTHPNGVNF